MPLLTTLVVDATCSVCGEEIPAGDVALQDPTVRHLTHDD
jgi:hypothetical protein